MITTYNEKTLEKARTEAINTYMLADLIGASVNRLLSDKATYPQIYDVFPHLFEKPKGNIQKQDWRLVKEMMLDFADKRNQERGEDGDNT